MIARLTQRLETATQWSAILTIFSLPISTSITLILFYLTTALVLLSGRWKEKAKLILNNPIALYFLLFYLLFLLGAIYTIADASTVKKELTRFGWLLLSPLWISLFQEERWQKRAINIFLIAMAITVILSFIKYFLGPALPHFLNSHHLHYRMMYDRTSVFKDYIIQSFLVSLATVIFLYRFLKRKYWVDGLFFLLGAMNVLFISQSRTGYIIFILLFGYTLLSQFTFKKTVVASMAGILLVAGISFFVPNMLQHRVLHAFQDIHQWQKGDKKTSLGYRMAWQANAVKLIQQRPVLGYGTGSIDAAYAQLPRHDTQQTGVVNNTSNEYLNIAVQFGLAGLVIFLGLLLLQWRYSYSLPSEYGFLIRTLLIALCVGNLANSWLMDFTQGYYYALMTAIAFAALSKHRAPGQAKALSYNDDAARGTHV